MGIEQELPTLSRYMTPQQRQEYNTPDPLWGNLVSRRKAIAAIVSFLVASGLASFAATAESDLAIPENPEGSSMTTTPYPVAKVLMELEKLRRAGVEPNVANAAFLKRMPELRSHIV